MKIPVYLSAVLLLAVSLATLRGAPSTGSTGVDSSSGSRRPELEYLKAVNSVAPPQDPQLLFLLMAQYSNANMQGEGAEFLSARLKEFGPRLTDPQKRSEEHTSELQSLRHLVCRLLLEKKKNNE